MKILFAKNSFAGPMSGADEIAVMYAVELRTAGHETGMLLVHQPTPDDPLVARLRAGGVPLTTLASPKFTASLAAGRKFAIRAMNALSPVSQLIRNRSRSIVFDLMQRYHEACCDYLSHNRPDVLHVITPDPGAVMLIRAAHATGVPVVYQEVGMPFHPPGFEDMYARLVTVLPLCAGVAVLSPRLGQEMIDAVPQVCSPRIVPLISRDMGNGSGFGVPPSGGVAATSNPGRLKAELQTEGVSVSQTVRFGFAARLEHLKGPLQFIEGCSIASRTHPRIELRIAGDGSQRQEIVRTLRERGLEEKCSLVGTYTTLEERRQFMQSIDVFVLPSLTEGTPNAIIEAMAHAKPIVATAVGGIPDVATADVGFLVPPNDVNSLGRAISKLAGDVELRERMGRAARKRYEQLFTPRVVLPLLMDFYERALNGHRSTSNGSNGLNVFNGTNGNGHHKSNRMLEEGSHPWAFI